MPNRSPIIFWLLLAATLAVDAVAVCWLLELGMWSVPASDAGFVLFFALTFSQISIVSIASVFAARTAAWHLSAPFVAALVAAVLMAFINEDNDAKFTITAVVIFELHAMAMMSTLLVLHQFRSHNRRWQFSLWHMLVVMTIAALLMPAVQSTKLVEGDWHVLVVMVADSVLLAVAALTAYFAVGHWVARLGALLAFALIAGWGLNSVNFPGLSWDWRALNLIQASVIFTWLSWGQIVPPIETASQKQEEEKTAQIPPR